MNDKGFKVGVLVALIAMIVVVGVGFAAFTTTLNINGTAKVEASSWNVHFADLGNGMVTTNTQTGIASTATVVTEPTLTDTTINDWYVTFKTPGDSVSYEFNVVNDGSFDARMTSPGHGKLPTPTCTGTGENADTDATNVCKHLEYKLEHYDASKTQGNEWQPISNSAIYYGSDIAPGESIKMRITLTYKDDVTNAELPKNEVTISNLEFSLVYTQI